MNGLDPAATLSWTIMFGLLGFSIWRFQKSREKRPRQKPPRLL
jgi:hypothetical protein